MLVVWQPGVCAGGVRWWPGACAGALLASSKLKEARNAAGGGRTSCTQGTTCQKCSEQSLVARRAPGAPRPRISVVGNLPSPCSRRVGGGGRVPHLCIRPSAFAAAAGAVCAGLAVLALLLPAVSLRQAEHARHPPDERAARPQLGFLAWLRLTGAIASQPDALWLPRCTHSLPYLMLDDCRYPLALVLG